MTMYDRATRALSRVKSVFFRLIISYVILVSVVAVTISSVALAYFQSRYNQELENFHKLYLTNIGKELEAQVVDASKRIYFELSNLLSQSNGDLLGPYEDYSTQPAKLYLSYQMLNALVAQHYERIEAIHLYYVRQDILVSSTGVGINNSDRWPGTGKAGLAELQAQGQAKRWSLINQPAYFGIPAISLFRSDSCFPILSTPADCAVVVSLDFRADYITQLIHRLQPTEGGTTVLISPESPLILGDLDMAKEAKTIETTLREVMQSTGSPFIQSIVGGSEPNLLSIIPVADTAWFLGNVVSHQRLYQRGEGIRIVLSIICVVAILVGIVVASFLSSSIYNPLGRLLIKVRTLMGLPENIMQPEHDEYRLMDTALDGISTRMDELQATIEANRPAIQNDLLARLLDSTPTEGDSVRDGLVLLGMPPLPEHLAVAVVVASTQGQTDLFQAGSTGQILKYRIISELEADFPGFLLAGTLPGGEIGMVVGLQDGSLPLTGLSSRLEKLQEVFGIRLTLAIGPAVNLPTSLAVSHAIASRLAGFHFLFPEVPVFADRPDLLDRRGKAALSGPEFLDGLRACLADQDLAQFKAKLALYRQTVRTGDGTPESCHGDLSHINQTVADFARTRQGNTDHHLRDLLAEADNLDIYIDELVSVAADLCAGSDHPQRQRNASLVNRIKEHVQANLSQDLSLDRVGNAVAVSPGYMCKLFKEETSQNFVSYVTEVRLSEAARLLSQSRDPIQEIGNQVGFHTPAYFIRLFKNRYGQTPLEYRRNYPTSEKPA